MHIVPNRSAVRGFIISAKYLNRGPHSQSSIEHQGYEMGLGIVIFADLAIRVRASGIKVAQPYRPYPMSNAKVIHHSLTR
jgi:hypothetical protein